MSNNVDLKKIDANLSINKSIEKEGYVWREATDAAFRLYGVYHDGKQYRRLPDDVAAMANDGIRSLATNTAGGRVRFVTDSKRVAIIAKMPRITRMPHMAFAGIFGFDMYVGNTHVKTFMPRVEIEDGYESSHTFSDSKERLITINMPLYNDVSGLLIGLDEGASVSRAPDYTYEPPVVFYGSSITQGGCASRPGNSYEAMLSRELDFNHINLGFSGSARGELSVARHIASLDMSAFVLDYDFNAPTAEHLQKTHMPFLMTVREAQPELPIIMISRPRRVPNNDEIKRKEIIRGSYLERVAAGDKNVYFIDGATLMVPDGTVDGTHPTDLGFRAMADGILPVLREALALSKNQ